MSPISIKQTTKVNTGPFQHIYQRIKEFTHQYHKICGVGRRRTRGGSCDDSLHDKYFERGRILSFLSLFFLHFRGNLTKPDSDRPWVTLGPTRNRRHRGYWEKNRRCRRSSCHWSILRCQDWENLLPSFVPVRFVLSSDKMG